MTSLSVLLVALGVLAGLARGGRVANITVARFRYPALVFAGLALQVGAELYALFVDPALREGGRGIAILTVSYSLLVFFVLANIRIQGMVLVGLGLGLNLTVITANEGMPVSITAASAAGFDPSDYLRTAVKHRRLGPTTRLPFLADVIPLPGLRKVISIGDVVFGAGIFFLVEGLVRYKPKRLRPSPGSLEEAEGQV